MGNYEIPVQYTHKDEIYMDMCWSKWLMGVNNIDTHGLLLIKSLWVSGQILLILEDLP